VDIRPAIIVEGKNDRSKLYAILDEAAIDIYCTFGTPGTGKLEQLSCDVGERPVYIFTDNDIPGKKIRAMLRDTFPDAAHIHTNRGYAGVEGSPLDYLVERLVKAGLEDYLLPEADSLSDGQQINN